MTASRPSSDDRSATGRLAVDYSPSALLATLINRRGQILAFALAVFATVASYTFLVSPTYEVTSAVLFKNVRADVPITAAESGQLAMSRVTTEDLNSEIEILSSRQLVQDVLRSLGIDEAHPPVRGGVGILSAVRQILGEPRLSYFEESVLNLEENLTFRLVPRSHVIEITYQSDDPDEATRIVQVFTEKYLEFRTQLHTENQAESFFEREAAESSDRLDDARQALQRFVDLEGVSILRTQSDTNGASAQKSLLLEKQTRFQAELTVIQVQVDESAAQVAILETQVAGEPERLPSSDRNYQDAQAEAIQVELARLHLRRDELSQNYLPESIKVKDIGAQIRLAEQHLADAVGRAGSINQTELNAIHQELRGNLLRARVELAGGRRRLATLQGEVDSMGEELRQLNRIGFELDRLQTEARLAEDNYLLYVKKHEEARVSAAMDQQKMVNASIARAAQRPFRPVAPRKALNLVLGLLLGVLGGIGLAIASEHFPQSQPIVEPRAFQQALRVRGDVSAGYATIPHRSPEDTGAAYGSLVPPNSPAGMKASFGTGADVLRTLGLRHLGSVVGESAEHTGPGSYDTLRPGGDLS